ncbi:hypothetical protein seszw2t2_63 [Salmonella phage seszw]|nr:hypothetical protein seszw2t2_63 [Salmonella phage seszw]
MSREYTKEEVREQFLAQVRHVYHYWANLPDKSDIDRCEGVAFSILNTKTSKSLTMTACCMNFCSSEANHGNGQIQRKRTLRSVRP